jgi:hypothetical protein
MAVTKTLMNDPDLPSRSRPNKTRWQMLEFEVLTVRGCLDDNGGNRADTLWAVLGYDAEIFDNLRGYDDITNPGPLTLGNKGNAPNPEGKGGPQDPDDKGKGKGQEEGKPRSRTPVDRGNQQADASGKGSGPRRDHSRGRGKAEGKGKSKDHQSATSHMTGKGRFHESEAVDGLKGWLVGMSIRHSTYCTSLRNHTRCEWRDTAKGCGFAHTKGEHDAHAQYRVDFVQKRLHERGWPWHAYDEGNRFDPNGYCRAGPSLQLVKDGDPVTQKGDPKGNGAKGAVQPPFNAWGGNQAGSSANAGKGPPAAS